MGIVILAVILEIMLGIVLILVAISCAILGIALILVAIKCAILGIVSFNRSLWRPSWELC